MLLRVCGNLRCAATAVLRVGRVGTDRVAILQVCLHDLVARGMAVAHGKVVPVIPRPVSLQVPRAAAARRSVATSSPSQAPFAIVVVHTLVCEVPLLLVETRAGGAMAANPLAPGASPPQVTVHTSLAVVGHEPVPVAHVG